MKKKDICLDTNVIIAYLLLTEPQHLLIENFLKRNPVENYYYTEHIKKETDKIFFEKYNLIYSIFNNFRKYLKSHHNEINSLNNFIYNFIQENNRKYVYKGKILSKKELKEILANYWYNQENNTVIEGFELFKNLSDILYEFSHESLNFKKSFLENLIFIKSHTKAYPNINKNVVRI